MSIMKIRKYSRKREAILLKLMSTKAHPTAEWIFDELKSEHPDIGIATVYRNLSDFCESKEIISLGMINGRERFDATTARHDHFICQDCGAIIDVPSGEYNDDIYAKLSNTINAKISTHHVTYYGICSSCRL